ncbi:MAG: hypothetical protein HZA01_14030 [Nitrospinae bacterium]|nr:hypothetical protein [Nitrospinota bacterium]
MKEPSALQPGERLSLALKSSQPYKIFRSLPSEDLYLMVLDAEPEDLELAIKYASAEQHRDIIDLYIWEKDEMHPELVMDWLRRLLECDEAKLIKVMAKLDPEILIYAFKKYILVMLHEDTDEPFPELAGIDSAPKSLDSQFFYFYLEKEFAETIDAILILVFNHNYQAYWNLMQGCRHELPLELIENAYYWRTNRMEEKGFFNYLDSQSIFVEFGMEEIERMKKSPKEMPLISTIAETGKIAAHSYFFGFSGSSFLEKAMEKAGDRQDMGELKFQTILIMNKLISASLPSMTDIKEIKNCIRRGMDTLSLALDYLSDGRPDHAAEFLSGARMETLFRSGFSLINNLARKLKEFFRESGIVNQETLFLLGHPCVEILNGILKSPPLFFNIETGELINFDKKEQIESAARGIDEAHCLDRLFCGKFKLQFRSLEEIGNSKLYQAGLSFSNLFISGLCNIILNRHFEFQPVPAARLSEIREKAFQLENGAFTLRQEYRKEFYEWIEELASGEKEKERRLAADLLKTWIEEFAVEIGSIHPARDIDPRFIKTFLIKAA